MKYRQALLTIVMLCAALCATAQRYVADNLIGDSIMLSNVKVTPEDTVITDNAFMIANGDTLVFCGGTQWTHHALMKYGGKLYSVNARQVRYCDDNPADLPNVVQSRTDQLRHTPLGHFFHTMTPFYLIAILVVVAALLSWIMRRFLLPDALVRLLMFVVPLALLAAAVLEAMEFRLSISALWFINQDRLGFWQTLLRMLPLMAVVFLQMNVGIDYKRALEEECDDTLSWRPVFVSIAVCVPIALITIIIVALSGASDRVQDISFIVAALVPLAIALLVCLAKNSRLLGFAMGLAFTLFSFVYAAGLIICAGILAVVVWKLFITAVISSLPFIVLFAGSQSSDGRSQTKYKGALGQEFSSESEAQRSKENARLIAEREKRKKEGSAW